MSPPLMPVKKPVSLAEMKRVPELAGMALLRQSRLSVCPVSDTEWRVICEMAGICRLTAGAVRHTAKESGRSVAACWFSCIALSNRRTEVTVFLTELRGDRMELKSSQRIVFCYKIGL